MRIGRSSIAAALSALLVFSSLPAAAQHVADPAAVTAALAARVASDEAARQTVLQALDRADVRAMADRLGLDIKDARSAVMTLSGDDLARAAQAASAIQADRAGGQQTIVISLTTLLLIIIIVILVAD